MYTPGSILYCTPFYFPNGSTAKPKYFITLFNDGRNLVAAALPTRQDYVPAHLPKKHGCINYAEGDFNAYYFSPDVPITIEGWSFRTHTYIYGFWVDVFDIELLRKNYDEEGKDYKIIGNLTEQEFQAIIRCLLLTRTMKNTSQPYRTNTVVPLWKTTLLA